METVKMVLAAILVAIIVFVVAGIVLIIIFLPEVWIYLDKECMENIEARNKRLLDKLNKEYEEKHHDNVHV